MSREAAPGGTATPTPRNRGRGLVWTLLVLVLVTIGLSGLMVMRSSRDLARAQGALELQVLTSRLGAAAIQAEYGQFGEALDLVSGVYDGIVNYGIEQGSLPENYATVLATRDAVVVALAKSDPVVKERLVDLFFLLQLPVDTELDSRYIIPATDSGLGMAPPHRSGTLVPQEAPGPQGADSAGFTSPARSDTGSVAPRDPSNRVRPDTIPAN